MYITSGIGASRHGESFGENYELPNLTAYAETCAAIGSVYWNHRLFLLTGDVKYYDVIERTLYNGLISGLSLNGEKFFYPNALESDGAYTFNQGACTRKSWFDCSCCPTNLIRFLPSIPGLIYSIKDHDCYVNLYVSNQADMEINGTKVNIEQCTDYPWTGDISILIKPNTPIRFTLILRIPGWIRNEVLPGDLYTYMHQSDESPAIKLNGLEVLEKIENGYVSISKEWNSDDEINIAFPMSARMVKANKNVKEDQGKRSLEFGPMVYCVEEIDNPGKINDLVLTCDMLWKVTKKQNLLHGVNVLVGQNRQNNISMTAIPYYAWSNRGIGAMKVWIPFNE